MIVEPQQPQKFTFTVEVNIDQLTQAYHLATETDEPESLESMIIHECHWLEQSGLYVQEVNQISSQEIHITWYDK